jgi:hypothetical protein
MIPFIKSYVVFFKIALLASFSALSPKREDGANFVLSRTHLA